MTQSQEKKMTLLPKEYRDQSASLLRRLERIEYFKSDGNPDKRWWILLKAPSWTEAVQLAINELDLVIKKSGSLITNGSDYYDRNADRCSSLTSREHVLISGESQYARMTAENRSLAAASDYEWNGVIRSNRAIRKELAGTAPNRELPTREYVLDQGRRCGLYVIVCFTDTRSEGLRPCRQLC